MVGMLNTIIGYLMYALFVWINVSYPVALFLATVLGIIFNYFTTGRIVFQSVRGLKSFGKFIASYSIVYFLNIIALHLAVNYFVMNPYMGQLLCLLPSALVSWLLMNNWVFKEKSCDIT